MEDLNFIFKLRNGGGIITLSETSVVATFPNDPEYQTLLANSSTPIDQNSDEDIWHNFNIYSRQGRTLEFRESLSKYELERLDSMLETLRHKELISE